MLTTLALLLGGCTQPTPHPVDVHTDAPLDPTVPTTSMPETTPVDEPSSTTDPTDDAPPCEADLLNDPENCGVCGVSCLGGGCFEGTCEPVPLLLEWSAMHAVAVKDGTIAGCNANDGRFVRQTMGADGPGEVTVDVLGGYCYPGWYSSDDGMAHVTQNEWLDVWSWDAELSTYDPTAYIQGEVAWFDGRICFVSFTTEDFTRELECMDPSNGARETLAVFQATDVNASGLKSGDGRLFVEDLGDLYEVTAQGDLTFVRALAMDDLSFDILAIDDGYLWTIAPTLPNGAGVKVLRVPIDGGDAEILAGVQDANGALALSDTHVYFFDGTHTFRRVPRDGSGPAETLYEEPEPDIDLVAPFVGDGFVVFTTTGFWTDYTVFALGID